MSSEEKLQAAYRAATIDCPLDGNGCPSADELAAAARGELDTAQRERMLAILGTCARCAALVQMAGELGETHMAPPPARVPRRPLWIGTALAAGIAMVAVWMLRPPESQITRGGAGEIAPVPNATLREPPADFAWNAPEAVACRVTVRSETADVVLRSESVLGGRLQLDAAQRRRLEPGAYLWTADCGGSRFGPYAFSVAP